MQKGSRHFSRVRSAKIDAFIREEKQFCGPTPQRRKLLDHVRDVLRVNHYSVRTEEAYVGWIRRFILYHNKKHPREMGALEVELYLTHLAVGEKVSTNTQKQALNALVFLYHRVLQKPLGQFRDISRPKKPQRRPLVLSENEVERILRVMCGTHQLIATLLLLVSLNNERPTPNVQHPKETAGGGARTHTALRPLDFESSASANSGTPALSRHRDDTVSAHLLK